MATQVNDLIWHFLGYLKARHSPEVQQEIYAGEAQIAKLIRLEDFYPSSGRPASEDEDDLPNLSPSAPITLPWLGEPPFSPQDEESLYEEPDEVEIPEIGDVSLGDHRPADLPLADTSGAPLSQGYSFHVVANYHVTGPVEEITTIHSVNTLQDNDVIMDSDIPYVPPTSLADIEAALGDMTQTADAATSGPLTLVGEDAEAVAETLIPGQEARANGTEDALQSKIIDAEGASNSGLSGWIQNKPLDELGGNDGTGEEEPEVDEESGAGQPSATQGQTILTGGNEATNAAAIVHTSDANTSFVVLGDMYETFSVTQTNVYMFDGAPSLPAPGSDPEAPVPSDTNWVSNDAELVFSDTSYTVPAPAGFALPDYTFNVDYVMGDFIDATLIQQSNVLMDNDVLTYSAVNQNYYISTGDNTLVNAAQFIATGHQYDMIIVAGDSNKFCLINQTNVMIDDDGLIVLDAEEACLPQGGQFALDGNTLENEAKILNIGGGDLIKPINPDVERLAGNVLDKQQAFDFTPEYFSQWGMPAYGDDMLDILVITGDYTKFLAVEQVNIVSDADNGLIVQSDGQGGRLTQNVTPALPGESGEGSVFEAGGNLASNTATIINYDSQSEFQYLGGSQYREAMLVQTNILAPEIDDIDDQISTGDPDALVSELIAFLHPDDAATPGTDILESAMAGSYVADDVMGGVLT